MTGTELLAQVKSVIARDKLRWSQHALARIVQRRISITAVLDTLKYGEAIKLYENGNPFPCVLATYTAEGPLHVVAAYDAQWSEAHVVTAYRPDAEHFEDDFKTRRKTP